eukprot:TRINITY_DN3891_c3_g1_i1.p1 TRINITY_DN3891_c3_g1~~TRINITY_DN3891_c3_g1_i1.p1  ORF type:complete len:567 (-),score=99.89 TRINITY_DN3891_c3_g1_i1:279-1979(-)
MVSMEELKDQGGNAYLQGNLAEAQQKYQQALLQKSNSNGEEKNALVASIQRNLSLVSYKLEQYKDSISYADLSIQIDPSNATGYIRKFMSLEKLGDIDAAIETLEQGVKNCDDQGAEDLKNLLAGLNSRVLSCGSEDASILKGYVDRLEKLDLENPVKLTVLSGFLGAGKTTLLTKILKENHKFKIAVIVNDMAEINIDGELISEVQDKKDIIQMENGCICCTLRDDLLEQVTQILERKEFNYIVIESTGISEPMPVAATFESLDSCGRSLRNYVQVDSMVSVVDVSQFMQQLQQSVSLKEKQMEVGEEDERSISDLLIDQVEFADIILLNKIDLLKDEDIQEIERIVQKLNPGAQLVRTEHSKVCLEKIINIGRFDIGKACQSAGWFQELEKNHAPETEEYGISSVVFQNRRPFHPIRFQDLCATYLPKVGLRTKGFFWLANYPTAAFELSIAGPSVNVNPCGEWTNPDQPKNSEDVNMEGDSQWGDRINKIVVIGQNLVKQDVYDNLMKCLATDEESAILVTQTWEQVVKNLEDEEEDEDEEEEDDDCNNTESTVFNQHEGVNN